MQSAVLIANSHRFARAFGRDTNRRSTCGHRAGLAIVLLAALAAGAAGRAQLPGTNTGSDGGQGMGRGGGFGRPSAAPLSNNDDTYDPVITERRMRALNAERQKQLVADANKLLKLAKELNDEVASASENAFTPEQLRKIAEIEKLAKNVRERMSAGIGETPSLISSPNNVVYPVH